MFEEDEQFEDETLVNEYQEWLNDDIQQRSFDLRKDMESIYD